MMSRGSTPSVRPERIRGACGMTQCQRPSTSLGTNEAIVGSAPL